MIYIVLLFFFISGACGLIYEVVWGREFILVLGGTTRAVTAVVVAFMGGLALGSIIGGRAVDRTRHNPLLIYGILEGMIGILALLVPVFIRLAKPLLAFAYKELADAPLLYDLVRFLVSALVLFPPTLLMGATLPVLVRATLAERERFGTTAGRLYAVNTAGAVLGVALAGFVLLPSLGGRLSILAAAAANICVCFLVILLQNRFTIPELPAPEKIDPGSEGRPGRLPLLILLGYGFSGLAALAYQIAWTRSLTLTLGGSTYSFSLILTAYISGLAIGGALITAWVDRIKKPVLWAGAMEISIGLSALAVLPILDNINLSMYRWVYDYQWEGDTLSFIRFGVTFGTVAVPTIIMGALLPLVAGIIGRGQEGAGEPMARVYAANTAGAIIGAFLAGYLLINHLGVRRTILFATLLSLAVGAMWVMASELRRRTAAIAGGAAMVIGLVVIASLPRPDPLVINSGPYMYADKIMQRMRPGQSVREVLHRNYEAVYFREDAETTVSVLQERIDKWRVLRINGKTDASTLGDMPNQVLLAHFPLLIHPDPKSVMVLGLASGVTAGSALLHPIRSLDCLELSPAVLEASYYFSDVNMLDYNDHRLRLIVNDGRNHLALGGDKYDVIISEPSNPWQAAMSALFTREFFELMKKSLNPGGIAVAWIDVYDMTGDTFALVLRTFADVFPYATLWESVPGADYIMMGSDSPFRIDLSTLKKRCRNPKIEKDLARIQAGKEMDIIARFIMSEERIKQAAGPGPLHTDDRRQLEFVMPKQAFTKYSERANGIFDKVLKKHQDASAVVELPEGDEGLLVLERLQERDGLRKELFGLELMFFSKETTAKEYVTRCEQFLARLGDRYPSRSVSRELADYMVYHINDLTGKDDLEARIALFKRAHQLIPGQSRGASIIASIKWDQGDVEGAVKWARAALERNENDPIALRVMAREARGRGAFEEEEGYWRRMLKDNPGETLYRLYLSISLIAQDKLFEAEAELRVLLFMDPNMADAHLQMAEVMRARGNLGAARDHMRKAIELEPAHPARDQVIRAIEEIDKKLGG
jgi:spermidine synthase